MTKERQAQLDEDKKLQKLGDVAAFAYQEVSLLQEAVQKAADAKAKMGGGVVDASAKHYMESAAQHTQENLVLMQELGAMCLEIHQAALSVAIPGPKNGTTPSKPLSQQAFANSQMGFGVKKESEATEE